MKLRGAEIVVRALEDEGVRFTFGIPGAHNIELYDALEQSKLIDPILVTDEQSASFMADAVSRTSDSVGVANVVPGAGVTHCLSGVAEAFMDNIPMIILTCAMRTDIGKSYQLHDIDQASILRPITKAVLRPKSIDEIYPIIRRAFTIACSGTPGPVAVEIPFNYFIAVKDIDQIAYREDVSNKVSSTSQENEEAAKLISQAKAPVLYVGNGARNAIDLLIELAEKIAAPVVTTIQGKGIFPENHPLWLWNNFGVSSPPFVRKIMDRCDCLLAVGCRFGEVATASYGLVPPELLIHVDINRDVFHCNYKARLAIESDAGEFINQLLTHLPAPKTNARLLSEIASGHQKVQEEWRRNSSKDKVTPSLFFDSLQRLTGPDTIYVTDSGNGTFLAMEHLRLDHPGRFLAPVDYSCMGYSVPAAIAAKLVHPKRDVVALSGDGALLMTGLELLTASNFDAAPIICILRDGEMGQIAQYQRTSLNRDTCSILSPYEVEDFARTVHSEFLKMSSDDDIVRVLEEALKRSREGHPVMVEVVIDYSHKTYFTKGIMTTNFWRLTWPERLRIVSRLIQRRLRPKKAVSSS